MHSELCNWFSNASFKKHAYAGGKMSTPSALDKMHMGDFYVIIILQHSCKFEITSKQKA